MLSFCIPKERGDTLIGKGEMIRYEQKSSSERHGFGGL